ncbi:hypothetical protein L484_008092 [Morus notabilis]|uniref:GDSL esterase/lipase n=1 Tax=Morus notabilis TaxID=981085 RepID=W9RRI3_9ROSA|nr:hypothetical protein L484_008092 [Morus notabilis]
MACNVRNLERLFSLFLIFFSTFFGGFIINLSEAHKAPAMFVCGDSLVDVGNNNHLKFASIKANFPYHRIDFPTRNATGRFGNGKIVADFLGT